MSTLSYLLTNNITDPRVEGLPMFGVGYGAGNAIQSYRVFNSAFNCVGSPYMSAENAASANRYGMSMDQYYMFSKSDFVDTEAVLGAEASGNGNWFQSLHQNDNYPMSAWSDCSALGYRRGVNFMQGGFASYGKFKAGQYLINQSLPAGVRPRRYFSISANVMYESSSLHLLNGTDDRLDITAYRPTGFTSSTSCAGAAGYNEKTKTLVITYGVTNTTTQINVFRSTVDLNSCNSLLQFFTNATATGFTITRSNYTAGDNTSHRTVLVGDNDYVFMSYRGGNTQYADLINLTTSSSVAIPSIGATTSYGPVQGPEYTVKAQSTWDNKWTFIFSPYYYYGCGAIGYVVSEEDPRRYFTFNLTSSSGGGAILPIGETKFAYFNGQNTDSAGVSNTVIDLSNTSTTGTDATTISTSGAAIPAAISNGGAINPTLANVAMHGGYYSTCYPRFFTINWWPIDGKFSYEGAVR